MQRRTTSLIALAAVAAIAVVSGYVVSKRNDLVAAAAEGPPTAPQAAAPVEPMTSTSGVAHAATEAPAATPENLAKWIADAMGGDAGKRATAIAALAYAPRAAAIPVLRRILTDGEPQVDRPLALRSLRDLALTQGDADGAIRDAVRNAIYHGDDQTPTDDVQEVLDIIEESELK
jgi:hypothetical protein